MPDSPAYWFYPDLDTKSEIRTAIETRDDRKIQMIKGYPAKFMRKSLNLGGFRERIQPGAFARTLKEGADVRALLNHNPDLVLGRTKSGTLALEENSVGLLMRCDTPDTQLARDLCTSIDRGDIDQGSFRFRTKTDKWSMEDGENIRDLVDVDLMDASVVTFPAYPDTSMSIRSAGAIAAFDVLALEAVLVRREHQLPVLAEDRGVLERAREAVDRAIAELKLDEMGRKEGDKAIASLLNARARIRLARQDAA
jgi:HK97 family phage prohead protease